MHERYKQSNIILVSGKGKKVGKSSLVERIIQTYSVNNSIIALKTSPHTHAIDGEQEVIKQPDFTLVNEHNCNQVNDSSRFLNAGADCSFYMQVDDENVFEGFNFFLNHFGYNNTLLIIESGSLFRKEHVNAIRIFVSSDDNALNKVKNQRVNADLLIKSSEIANFEFNRLLRIKENKWILHANI